MSGAEMKIERGSVRRGSFTSPPITAQSSSPAKAKAIEAQRLSSEQVAEVRHERCGVIGVAAGRVNAAYTPSATSRTPGR